MPFDLSDNYENFGPYINQPAPSTAAPANVIDSEIDEDASQSEPESVLRNPENQQPTPSDDTTMLWPGYFQPSPDRAVPNRIQVRQPAFRNTSPQKRK